ncbi:phosphatidic acid phosphatase type 2/haloperoxidase [Blakeslea trispora]|nr:phosphatidic acid phosphatase type 2/haloperoxidase [Blakeslea trispora]
MLKDPFQKRIVLSYAYDWACVVIMTVAFFAIDKIEPFRRRFSLEDKTIMFPYTEHESVPIWLLAVIAFVAPILIIAFVSLSNIGFKRSFGDFHSGVLGLCLGLSMTIMLTDVIKITAGRPRPDMLSRCQPALTAVDPTFGLSTIDICTSDINSHMMRDGFKSFPSGHSSFSFAGLGYLALYLAGKIRMFDKFGYTYKGFMFAFPVIGALLVAVSRTEDYRHHWQDVSIGAILGTICAYFAYRQYYPSLSRGHCGIPFSDRVTYLREKLNKELGVVSHDTIPLYDPHQQQQQDLGKYQQDCDMNDGGSTSHHSGTNLNSSIDISPANSHAPLIDKRSI